MPCGRVEAVGKDLAPSEWSREDTEHFEIEMFCQMGCQHGSTCGKFYDWFVTHHREVSA